MQLMSICSKNVCLDEQKKLMLKKESVAVSHFHPSLIFESQKDGERSQGILKGEVSLNY
jgi:hypothetical protein